MRRENPTARKRWPPQHQDRQPGLESEMVPRPQAEPPGSAGSGKLQGKVALITGGDSGIGRAVAVAFAREGADVAIAYLNEHGDAEETRRRVEREGKQALLLSGDVGDESFCREAVAETLRKFSKLNLLVNNAAEEHPLENLEEISAGALERTFRTNIFSFFYMTKWALRHLREGDAIINTTSITAFRGSPNLVDYSSTKGAIVAFTRSLAKNLIRRGIRVNAVAPGPVWTPLIPATTTRESIPEFGSQVPMGRAGQPGEIAPSYVFLACHDSSYMTGTVLHPNGGEPVGS